MLHLVEDFAALAFANVVEKLEMFRLFILLVMKSCITNNTGYVDDLMTLLMICGTVCMNSVIAVDADSDKNFQCQCVKMDSECCKFCARINFMKQFLYLSRWLNDYCRDI